MRSSSLSFRRNQLWFSIIFSSVRFINKKYNIEDIHEFLVIVVKESIYVQNSIKIIVWAQNYLYEIKIR